MAFKINNLVVIDGEGLQWDAIAPFVTSDWYFNSKAINRVIVNSGTNTALGTCCSIAYYRATSNQANCSANVTCTFTWDEGTFNGDIYIIYNYNRTATCTYSECQGEYGFWRNNVAALNRVAFPNWGDNFSVCMICS
jgi:hypothetical protein